MSTTDKRAVKFVQAWRGYSAGEIAGFDEKVAVQLVKSKVAEEYSAEGEKTPAPQNPAKQPAQRQPASTKRGKTDATAPAPGPAEGGTPGGSPDPGAGTADTSNPAGAEGSQTDTSNPAGTDGSQTNTTAAAAGTGGSADNDDRP